MKKKAITVTLPAPHKAQIKCPICKGNKCVVCNMSGTLKIDVAPKIPIQRAHIIKYIRDNIHEVAGELTKMYGLVPEIATTEITEVNDGLHFTVDHRNHGQFEVVQISSLGGACWVVNRLDELDTPRYFTSRQELEKFKQGWMN